MAKKRKRQEERKEEREYKPPEFDKREYVTTEVGVSKATILSAVFSIPMGLVAMFVMPVGGFGGGILVGLSGMGMLWFLLPLTGIDVKPFKPMQWAGVMSTYFLVFLTVWVVLCNPPFNDYSTPEIRNVQVGWDEGGTMVWVNVTASGLGGGLQARIPANATDITIRAQVTDNVAVDTETVIVERVDQSEVMARTSNPAVFEASFSGVEQFQNFRISAADASGNAHPGLAFTILH